MNAITTCGAALVLAATAATAGGQVTKTMTGDVHVMTATVESIERASREVTVKKSDGTYDVLYFPEAIKRFDDLKVGDTVNARYYETIVLQLKTPGEKDVDTSASTMTRTAGTSGTAAHQQTITATITAIDPAVPSITFTGPHGWTYMSRVEDTNALSKVKVGDKVDITWTAALVLSAEPAK